MSRLSPRQLDRAVERRWPFLFRFDLRQTVWTVLAMQAFALSLILTDRPAGAAGPVAASVGLLARCLLELKRDAAAEELPKHRQESSGGNAPRRDLHAASADLRAARAAKARADQAVITRQGGQGAGQGGVGGGMGF